MRTDGRAATGSVAGDAGPGATATTVAVADPDGLARRQAEIARHLETRLLAEMPAAVVVTDEDGIVVYWNERATRVFGPTAADAIGRPLGELGARPRPDDLERIERALRDEGRWEGAYDIRRTDGRVVSVYATVDRIVDEEIGFRGVIGASVDVSERRKAEAELAFMAFHDPLTGLPNRRMLFDHLDGAVARGALVGTLTSVLLLDVDDFKALNDSIGHSAGDEVLRSVADLITGVTRPRDMVSRLAADEFVVCCEDVADVEEAHAVAERMLQVLRAPFRLDGRLVTVSASVGVAVTRSATSGEALLRHADAAMYAAKQAGKGRVEVFDDSLYELSRRRKRTAAELEEAIASGGLVTYFQPEVDLGTGCLFGFEALVRWQHPQRGLVPPDEFIAIAEEHGSIGRLGALVLDDACRALARWGAVAPHLPLVVSVNVSARQLTDPDLPSAVLSAIGAAGVRPEQVCLEVTESALMDTPAAADALRALRAAGVAIAIDDFGTGYSSLSRLKRFPVDFLKIDREFVAGLGRDVEDGVIVSAVVSLGRELGIRVVAEGIERPDQHRHLDGLACELGQGHLWSRAVPLEEATALVTGPQPPWGPSR